eukprot:TRINITY_DN5354_c0_g1_i1.p1 TRINITY_DN5354_c0_g1~~TRINITY_DN5354_c0_g1_i1.p1  ORF type:complete len:163 (+),score=21.99 TRINITY_DN5354_c0_g1_i1:104-592(+)
MHGGTTPEPQAIPTLDDYKPYKPTTILEPEQKEWPVIYPVYLDKKKKWAEGRRIPTKYSAERPSCQEIAEICKYLKLPFVIEPYKCYPKDALNQHGRIRVKIKNSEGKPINSEIPTKNALLKYCGTKISGQTVRNPTKPATAAAPTVGTPSKGKGKKSGKKK